MAKILDMPKLSPTMEEGVLSAWHKKEGDKVEVDDLLAEVETDKATMEFRAFDRGTILKVLVPAGTQVKLGQAVAILGKEGEDITALLTKVGASGATMAPPQGAEKDGPDTDANAGAEAGASDDGGADEPAAETQDEEPGDAEKKPEQPAAARKPTPAPAKKSGATRIPAAASSGEGPMTGSPDAQRFPNVGTRAPAGSPLDRTEREGARPQSQAVPNGAARANDNGGGGAVFRT